MVKTNFEKRVKRRDIRVHIRSKIHGSDMIICARCLQMVGSRPLMEPCPGAPSFK